MDENADGRFFLVDTVTGEVLRWVDVLWLARRVADSLARRHGVDVHVWERGEPLNHLVHIGGRENCK